MEKKGTEQRGVWFNFASDIQIGDTVDIIYKIQKDTYNNKYKIVLLIDDLRPT